MWTLFSPRPQLVAAATALTAAGFLTVAPPAQAHPLLPFPQAPACSQWGFDGTFSLKQSNGDFVRFNATGPSANGAIAVATGGINGSLNGTVTGGVQGDNLDFTIDWAFTDHQLSAGYGSSIGHYTGAVGADGFAHGNTVDQRGGGGSAHWDSTVSLVCTTPAAAPAPPPAAPPAAPAPAAAARLGVSVNGPTTLAGGMTSGYTVNVSNPGDLSAPVELYVSFGGNLQQSGQVTPSGGFNCDVINNAGGTTAVHCTAPQLPSKATETILVQGRGSQPGAGHLTVNINSSDPAAQFVQKSQQLNVTVT